MFGFDWVRFFAEKEREEEASASNLANRSKDRSPTLLGCQPFLRAIYKKIRCPFLLCSCTARYSRGILSLPSILTAYIVGLALLILAYDVRSLTLSHIVSYLEFII